jgi:heat shock protein HslJ
MPEATLEDTYWKLIELDGRPVRVAENIAEPHLVLHAGQLQARGSTGCNRFFGPYALRGDSLRLGPLASTRRACPDPELTRQDHAFLVGLEKTRHWRVTGDTLTFGGEAGQGMRFEARHLGR